MPGLNKEYSGTGKQIVDDDGEILAEFSKTGLTLADGAAVTVDDSNISGSTPVLTFTNTTATDSDGGRVSSVTFKGTQSGSEVSTLAKIDGAHDGASDDEQGDLIFYTNDGSDGDSPTEAMRIDSNQVLRTTRSVGEAIRINTTGAYGWLSIHEGDVEQAKFGHDGASILGGSALANSAFVQSTGALHLQANTNLGITIESGGNVGVGPTAVAADAILEVEGDATNGAQLLTLDQNDTDQPFIDFQGTASANATDSISTLTTSGGTTHHIQIEINGTKAWIAASTTDPS